MPLAFSSALNVPPAHFSTKRQFQDCRYREAAGGEQCGKEV